MELLDDLVTLGPDGIAIYRRQVGSYFSLTHVQPWRDDSVSELAQVSMIPDGRSFDLVLDQRFCLFKTAGAAQGMQPLAVLQSDGVLTVAARDVAALEIFTLSIGIDTITEALQRFAPVSQRIKRLILRMPSHDIRSFVFLDWDVLSADPSRVDLAVKVANCIFLPRLVSDLYGNDQEFQPTDKATVVPSPILSDASPVEQVPVFAVAPPRALGHASDLSAISVDNEGQANLSVSLPEHAVGRRRLSIILPLSDDLRTSFLGFGYSVGTDSGHGRVLEIGAFRRNLRSSYSRLMGVTDGIDLKAQPPTPDVLSELERTLRQMLANRGDVRCFIGSEVLSAEVLEVFRSFAAASDLAIHAIICAASAPSAQMMELIQSGLAGPALRVLTICFVPAGEPSGFIDALGRPRGYFGVPPVEGQSMARCMEFRSNVDDPAFVVPDFVSPRETHLLERFVSAFRPLREDLDHPVDFTSVDRPSVKVVEVDSSSDGSKKHAETAG